MSPVSHSSVPAASPLTTGVGRYLKRGLDICLSLPVVVILLPPAAVVTWLAHRLQSPGPLLFRQERCGLGGRRFTILKFRTMNPERADAASETQSRIFPIGNILRKTKIDEIPQFVNTLIGTMSIVGPRPHHFADCEQFGKEVEEYSLRTVAKPGITGLAQYKEYRGDFEWNCVSNRVQRDLAYIREWSLLLDLRLIVKTANVIRRKCWQAAVHKVEHLPMVEKAGPRLGIFSPFTASARPVKQSTALIAEEDSVTDSTRHDISAGQAVTDSVPPAVSAEDGSREDTKDTKKAA
ncbi:MAG: sugar transferase [Planctomycetaceae bacterium]|nr:sugar transferase [Planctomycetaceae bacterium]